MEILTLIINNNMYPLGLMLLLIFLVVWICLLKELCHLFKLRKIIKKWQIAKVLNKRKIIYTPRIHKVMKFININYGFDFVMDAPSTVAVSRWSARDGICYTGIICIDPNHIYRVPINSEELSVINSIAHEFGHIYNNIKNRHTSDQHDAMRANTVTKICSEQNAWNTAARLLKTVFKDDKVALSEFDKHYEFCISTYIKEIDNE